MRTKPVDFIVDEHFDCVIEGGVWVDVDQVLHIVQHLCNKRMYF